MTPQQNYMNYLNGATSTNDFSTIIEMLNPNAILEQMQEKLKADVEEKVYDPQERRKLQSVRQVILQIEEMHNHTLGPRWKRKEVKEDVEIHQMNPISYKKNVKFQQNYILSFQKAVSLEMQTSFALLTSSRFEDISDSALERVLLGLSRVVDFSNISDLQQLAQEVRQRHPHATANSVLDIRAAAYPIFAILYKPDPTYQAWQLSNTQMQQLFEILRAVTGGLRARIWLMDIARMSFSRGARMERICLLPYSMFPSVVLPGTSEWKKSNTGLLCRMQRFLAAMSFGFIQVERKNMYQNSPLYCNMPQSVTNILDGGGAYALNDTDKIPKRDIELDEASKLKPSPRFDLESRNNPDVKKKTGAMLSIQDAWNILVTRMVNGHFLFSGVITSSASVSELQSLAVQIMRGDSIDSVVLGLGSTASPYTLLDAQKDSVFRHLWKNAEAVGDNSRTQRRYSASKWEGLLEFLSDAKLARALGIHNMRRTYECMYGTVDQHMLVIATLHGQTNLHGVIAVERTGSFPRQGQVISYISNVNEAACDSDGRDSSESTYRRLMAGNGDWRTTFKSFLLGNDFVMQENLSADFTANMNRLTQVYKTEEIPYEELQWT